MQHRIKLFGEVKSSKAYRIRDFLQRNGVQFQWIEISCDDDAESCVGLASLSDPGFPVLTVGDRTLYAPSLTQIVQAIGWAVTPAAKEYDLAVYGAGPAGLSAAVYGASEGLRTILVERYSIGGQAASTSRIENYLGFPEGISGQSLRAVVANKLFASALKSCSPQSVLREKSNREHLLGCSIPAQQ